MLPMSEIKIGDVFSNPLHRGYGESSGLIWVVEDKKEGMVKVQPFRTNTVTPYGTPIWKSNRDRMFSEAWREITNGR